MARVFRAMSEDNGKPRIGKTARCLGVRPKDVAVAPDGTVAPDDEHGMSVAPTWRQLPIHRIPSRLKGQGVLDARGKDEDKCWRRGEGSFVTGAFSVNLRLCVTSAGHGVVQPQRQMLLADYEHALAGTQPDWVVDET